MKNIIVSHIVSFLVIFSCTAAYSMEKDKKIFLWDKNHIDKIISKKDEHSLYANIQDDSGQTPLLFLLVNNRYKDSKELLVIKHTFTVDKDYVKFENRTYTYDPNVLKKFIILSDLNIKNSDNKTSIDYLLIDSKKYDVHALNDRNQNVKVFINSDYPYVNHYASTKNASYELFKWLLFAVFKSGYNFSKNPQTTLELLGDTFDDIAIAKNLLQVGITGGSTFNYFKEEKINTLRYKCMKYETFMQDHEKLKRLLEQEDNPDFLVLLFSRAVSLNQQILLRLLCKELPKTFTPLYGFQRASDLNQHACLYYILQSFSSLTLRNVLLKMCSKETNILKAKFDEELYKCCQEAESTGNHIFCNKVAAIAALRCYRKNKCSLPQEIIAHILEYIDL